MTWLITTSLAYRHTASTIRPTVPVLHRLRSAVTHITIVGASTSIPRPSAIHHTRHTTQKGVPRPRLTTAAPRQAVPALLAMTAKPVKPMTSLSVVIVSGVPRKRTSSHAAVMDSAQLARENPRLIVKDRPAVRLATVLLQSTPPRITAQARCGLKTRTASRKPLGGHTAASPSGWTTKARPTFALRKYPSATTPARPRSQTQRRARVLCRV